MPMHLSKFMDSFKQKFSSDSKMSEGQKAVATVNGKVIAEADTWEKVEGNIYVGTP